MWEAIAANRRRSFGLIFLLAGVLIGLGYVVGIYIHPELGVFGALTALLVWLALAATAFTGGRKIMLSSAGARRITHSDYPRLFNVVEEMQIASGLPKMPEVYIIDSDAPNAFAVGAPDEAAVAVTTGLLMRLNRDELQGVVAHEIGHVVNNDTRFMTLAGVMVASIVVLSDFFLRMMVLGGGRRRSRRSRGGGGGGTVVILIVGLLFVILAPIIARLLYLACSRKREYLADACSARFTRYPEGLAGALEKIEDAAGRMKKVNRAVAPMFTVNPLQGGPAGLFSTHPPTQERVRVLRSMVHGASYADYQEAYSDLHGKGLIGNRTLAEDESTPVREPSSETEKGDLEKAREVMDILHRQEGMLMLACTCGLRTKVPPSYNEDSIRCPKCGRAVAIPRAMLATAAAAGAAGAAALGEDQEKNPPAGRAEQEELVYRYKPGEWQTFKCACGQPIQLSPNFRAPRTRCPACNRQIQIERL